MEIRRHAAGHSFVQPHLRFGGILRSIPPAHRSCRVGGGDIARKLPVHDGGADAALQAASPHCWVVGGSALIVGLEPYCGLAELIEIGAAADVASKVGEEKAIGLFLFRDRVVLVPQLKDAVIECVPVSGCIR